MSDWHLYVRDEATKARIAELDLFDSIEIVLLRNDVSTWILEAPLLDVSRLLSSFTAGLVVVRDGLTVISGPVTHLERSWGTSGDHLQIAGVDDTVSLQRRLAYPDPTHAVGSETQTRDVQTDPAETLLKHYVDVNAGPGALVPRRVAGLTIETDTGAGTTLTKRPRYDGLLELLQEIATEDGLTFRIVQSGAGVVFEVATPVDRSAEVKFSQALGNLEAGSHSLDGSQGNVAIVGGDGKGIARTFVEVIDTDSVSSYGRIETFVDERSTSDTGELTDAGNAALADLAEQVQAQIVPIETAATRYGVDWNLGDTVSVVIDGEALVEVVQEVDLRFDSQGERIVPVVGTPDATTELGLFTDIRNLSARISSLETSEE